LADTNAPRKVTISSSVFGCIVMMITLLWQVLKANNRSL
jgi:hypothetical protein